MKTARAKWIAIAALLLGAGGMAADATRCGSAASWDESRLYMKLSDRQHGFLSASRKERERIIANAEARSNLCSGAACAVDGVINFRDIGGMRVDGGMKVRKGVLFRSGRFDQISQRGRRMLVEELGVRTDLDLRGVAETSHLCGSSPLGTNVVWRLVPLLSYGAIGSKHGREQMRAALGAIFDKRNWPIAFHCKTGKDRTGTLAFIVLALLGVAEEDICLDWEVTAFYVPELSRMDHPRRYDRLLAYLEGLPGKDLREKAQGYVLSLGFPLGTIESFCHDMLEL